jgi:coenzyme F420-reducing hydrogenase gamma subunit
MAKKPIRLSYVRFTSCSGCQLMLLNAEDEWASLSHLLEFQDFPLVSSEKNIESGVDLVLVEGSISTPDEVGRLLDVRRRADFLVAVGSCALSGGVNRLLRRERYHDVSDIYDSESLDLYTFPPQPVGRFVTVDFEIRGCPPERHELLETLSSLSFGGWPGRQLMSVCMECKILECRCLLIEDFKPCLGPVTQAGCRARCPSQGIGCEGCRGEIENPNHQEMLRLLLETGLSERDAINHLNRFEGG